MNIILMWLTTVIASKSMDFLTSTKLIKNIYANGYKLKQDNFINYVNAMKNLEQYKNKKIMSYIPFVNILNSLFISSQAINNLGEVILQFQVLDIIEEMTKEEIKAYKEKPTFLNALALTAKSSADAVSSLQIKVEDNEEKETSINVDFTKTSGLKPDQISVVISKGKPLTEEDAKIIIAKQLDLLEKHSVSKKDLVAIRTILETVFISKNDVEKEEEKVKINTLK